MLVGPPLTHRSQSLVTRTITPTSPLNPPNVYRSLGLGRGLSELELVNPSLSGVRLGTVRCLGRCPDSPRRYFPTSRPWVSVPVVPKVLSGFSPTWTTVIPCLGSITVQKTGPSASSMSPCFENQGRNRRSHWLGDRCRTGCPFSPSGDPFVRVGWYWIGTSNHVSGVTGFNGSKGTQD